MTRRHSNNVPLLIPADVARGNWTDKRRNPAAPSSSDPSWDGSTAKVRSCTVLALTAASSDAAIADPCESAWALMTILSFHCICFTVKRCMALLRLFCVNLNESKEAPRSFDNAGNAAPSDEVVARPLPGAMMSEMASVMPVTNRESCCGLSAAGTDVVLGAVSTQETQAKRACSQRGP
jgi:hypothetical protein